MVNRFAEKSQKPTLSDLWREGVTFRQLGNEAANGFIIRLLEGEGSTAQILTVVKQPGDHPAVANIQPATYVHHPEGIPEHRYYPSGEFHPSSIEMARTVIEPLVEHNDIARIALQHLHGY